MSGRYSRRAALQQFFRGGATVAAFGWVGSLGAIGCARARRPPEGALRFSTRFLSPPQAELVRCLTELILPEPSGKAGAALFVDEVLQEAEPEVSGPLLDGLTDLDRLSGPTATRFVDLSGPAQVEQLRRLDQAVQRATRGTSLEREADGQCVVVPDIEYEQIPKSLRRAAASFVALRRLTLTAHLTSADRKRHFHGSYDGCSHPEGAHVHSR